MALAIEIAAVGNRQRNDSFSAAVADFAKRLGVYAQVRTPVFETEAMILEHAGRQAGRVAPFLVLLDGPGKSLSSEAFAKWLGHQRDSGRQSILFAIGPANGWSQEARARADLLLSLGPMTLPHELARVVLIEQVYRAFTILIGHPYHTGH